MTLLSRYIFLVSLYIVPIFASSEYRRPAPRPLVFRPHDLSDSDPQQVHISLAGQDYMLVTWITEDEETESMVEYGRATGKYDNSTTGESSSYKYLLYKSGQIHRVKIGPLEPSTVYYYRCGGGNPEFSYRTPPTTFPMEFVVAGDLGQTEWTESTLQHVGAMDYDALLLPGDLSYADTLQPLWDSFGRLVQPYASTRPWMVTQGNHEIETIPILHSTKFTAYNSRWRMPYQESGSSSNLYYSFEVAGTHVIMLGSYDDFDANSDQYKWLQRDLASVDRSRTPWIFVLLHAPWYNSNLAHIGEGESMRLALEETLYKASVDLVIAGHVHAYERFTRIYDNKADACGPIYMTVGDGGNREGLASDFKDPQPSISLYREASFGHGRLRVLNSTHAHWSWLRNNESSSVVADETWFLSLSSTPSCKRQSSVRV